MPLSAKQREASQQLLQVHDLPGGELGDGEPDDVGNGVEVGDHAPHLRAGQPVRFSAEPEHDLIAVDGIHIEMDGDPGATRPDRSSFAGVRRKAPRRHTAPCHDPRSRPVA